MNIIDSEAKLAEIEQYNRSLRDNYVSPVDILVSQNESLCATVRQLWERDRWIPVSERLPEPGVAVLIGYGTVVEWGYFRNPKYRGPRAAKWHNQHRPTDLVTHWRPLPAPPPETEEQP